MEPVLTTLQDAILYFSDSANCREYVVARRWPNGVECPRCGSDNVTFLEKYNRWQCSARHEGPHLPRNPRARVAELHLSLKQRAPRWPPVHREDRYDL